MSDYIWNTFVALTKIIIGLLFLSILVVAIIGIPFSIFYGFSWMVCQLIGATFEWWYPVILTLAGFIAVSFMK